MSSSVQYRHPWLYTFLAPLIHHKRVLKAFRQEVGMGVTVLDIAAGYGGMAKYIDPSNRYRGVDLHPVSLAHAQHQGLDIRQGDIFDPAAYSDADVLILVDVIHHMPEDRLPQLFDLVFTHARQRVVIMEPYYMNLSAKYGTLTKPIEWFLRVMDNDGTNTIERWLTEAEYRTLFENRFSSAPGQEFELKIQRLFPYFIVTYDRKQPDPQDKSRA